MRLECPQIAPNSTFITEKSMYFAGRNQVIDAPLTDAIAGLKAAGADGVELCHESNELAPETMNAAVAEAVAEMLREAGLRASAAGWHCDYAAKDECYELIQPLIGLTPRYGTDVFIIACAGARGDESLWGRLVERTRRLCRIAEDAGVRLAVEYEPGFLVGDSASLERLFGEVASEALWANLDLGHVFLCEDDPLATVRRLAPRTAHGHVENMAAGVHRHRMPWDGDMDLGAYLGTLREAGFDGFLAADLYGIDYLAEAARVFSYLHGLLPE